MSVSGIPAGLGLVFALVAMVAVFLAGVLFMVKRRVEARLRSNQEMLRAAFDESPIGMAELDPEGAVVRYNNALGVLLQATEEEIVGSRYVDLVEGVIGSEAGDSGTESPGGASIQTSLAIEPKRSSDTEGLEPRRPVRFRSLGGGRVTYQLGNGIEIWVEESCSEFEAADGSIHRLVQAVDVSEERKSRDELQRRVLHDGLTHLPNRTLLGDRIVQALIRGQRFGTVTAVVFLDIDYFKAVNDSLGHSAGDLLLREVAKRLRSSSRTADTIARFGGDEFVMLCEGLTSSNDALGLAERLRQIMAAPIQIGERSVSVTLSIGVAVASKADNPEALLRDADLAMYQAKEEGRNRVVLYEREMRDLLVDRLELEDDLRRAIAGGGLRLHYQPVLDLKTNEIVGYESLVRWLHPMRGLLSPPDFFEAAERLDLLADIDAWTLEAASSQLADWLRCKQVPATCVVSVNASASNFIDAGYPALVMETLARTGLSPDHLVIELGEDAVLANTDRAAKIIGELRSIGVRVAIDGFGAGYSSFSQLASLRFDILKIDRSFTQRVQQSSGAQVVSALVQMAQALGLRTVAEGVESDADLAVLRQFGSDMAQGYVVARPMPAIEVLDVVKKLEGAWSAVGAERY